MEWLSDTRRIASLAPIDVAQRPGLDPTTLLDARRKGLQAVFSSLINFTEETPFFSDPLSFSISLE